MDSWRNWSGPELDDERNYRSVVDSICDYVVNITYDPSGTRLTGASDISAEGLESALGDYRYAPADGALAVNRSIDVGGHVVNLVYDDRGSIR